MSLFGKEWKLYNLETMKIKNVYLGSWFQRTTLHLSEVYDFLVEARSPLSLDSAKLRALNEALDISNVHMKVGELLEHVEVITNKGIDIDLYEDGLVVMRHTPKDVKESIALLTKYYEDEFSSSISYVFSLGAPIPKELANIKTVFPYFIVVENASAGDIETFLGEQHQQKYFEIKSAAFDVYRGDELYVINNKKLSECDIEAFVGEQIFAREFKGQLHRYLNLHRIIWEKIDAVKEIGSIKGSDIKSFKMTIDRYSKTINLIEARINQMGVYVKTREAAFKGHVEEEMFKGMFEFKYDALLNTLSYVKEIWKMTNDYLVSAEKLFSDLQAKSTENSVKNLTVVTSMGVGATLIGLFTQKAIPDFTWFGLLYFAILAFIGYMANKVMKAYYMRKNYAVKDTEIDTNIQ